VDDEGGGEHAVAPIRRFRKLSRFVAAAAAVVVAPKFLVAASIVTFVAVSTYVVRNSAESLPFQDAVAILMDEQEADHNRDAALGRVVGDLEESIGTVRAVSPEPTEVGQQALTVLRSLRQQLEAADSFVLRRHREDLAGLCSVVADRGLDLVERQDAMARLEDLLLYGATALKAFNRSNVGERLKRKSGAYLDGLLSLLE
jgi:hypothetical protein